MNPCGVYKVRACVNHECLGSIVFNDAYFLFLFLPFFLSSVFFFCFVFCCLVSLCNSFNFGTHTEFCAIPNCVRLFMPYANGAEFPMESSAKNILIYAPVILSRHFIIIFRVGSLSIRCVLRAKIYSCFVCISNVFVYACGVY